MARYAGIASDGSIQVISDAFFINTTLKVVEIPLSFEIKNIQDFLNDYIFIENTFRLKNSKKLIKELKVAFITNWAMKCGIATYAKSLFSEIINYVGDYKFFIEYNNNPVESIYNLTDDYMTKDKIIECWRRGEELSNLINNIKEYNPDLIIINQEFGIFPNARYFLSLLTQLSNYRTITILHSVYHHLDKLIIESALQEIVVHLDLAKTLLQNEKGIKNPIYVIPHGCNIIKDQTKLWNFYKSEHTIIQSGFAFRYKNFQHSIQAISILKEKYPDIFLTALLSETDFNKYEHQSYYNDLSLLINKLNLQNNVALVRGYQSDQSIDAYYRSNSIAVFPYSSHPEHIVYGASGSCRIALSKGLPVITSSIPHFSDIPTIKADTPDEIAKQLDLLFSNPQLQKKQIEIQNKYIKENSWDEIAKKYLKIFDKSP